MPRVTFDSTRDTPALVNTDEAYTPHGTVLPHKATNGNEARSPTERTDFGFPGFTAIAIVFRAKTFGVTTTLPEATSFSILVRSADAKTSLGAPD